MGNAGHRLIPGGMLSVLLMLSAVIPPVFAETRYVSDTLIITVRQHPDQSSETLTTLKTDTPVIILGERGQFAQVRTPDGLEGWVLKQYLTPAPPKTGRIQALEEENERLRSALQAEESQRQKADTALTETRRRTETKVNELSALQNVQEKEIVRLKEELAGVSRDYENLKQQSLNVVELAEDRDRLRTEQETLGSELRVLRTENEKLRREGMISWFLAGAAVFFAGWVVGRMSRKKKSYY